MRKRWVPARLQVFPCALSPADASPVNRKPCVSFLLEKQQVSPVEMTFARINTANLQLHFVWPLISNYPIKKEERAPNEISSIMAPALLFCLTLFCICVCFGFLFLPREKEKPIAFVWLHQILLLCLSLCSHLNSCWVQTKTITVNASHHRLPGPSLLVISFSLSLSCSFFALPQASGTGMVASIQHCANHPALSWHQLRGLFQYNTKVKRKWAVGMCPVCPLALEKNWWNVPFWCLWQFSLILKQK